MLGANQEELYRAAERNERIAAKKKKQERDAEMNRRKQRGEIIRYPERDK